MPDRERVIKSIANCPRLPFDLCFGECQDCDCPYYGEAGIEKLHHDALALLKEQETADTGNCRVFQCEKCGYGIDDIFVAEEEQYQIVPRYCPNCGRRVKLE